MIRNFILTILFSGGLFVHAQTVGLISNTNATDGYVLYAPNTGNITYLIDKCGYQVHSWTSTHLPGQSAYLLEDGSLLRTGRVNNASLNGGGLGGIIERFDWNGNLTWSYTISSSNQSQHHDIRPLPNGNVLAIVWEIKTVTEATAKGRNPSLLGTNLWSEKIVEIQPSGLNGGTIVWEWHVWDHLIQDFDTSKPAFGVVTDHPELININFSASTTSDWLHCNALDYNADLDQIILSSHNLSEFWIIDHSTSTAEAATHSGGAHNKGGDLLYRWGNPASYNRGTAADKKLFGQHNTNWIPNGYPGSGEIIIFNNGLQRPTGNYSTVEVMNPPIDANGDYNIAAGQAFLPLNSDWIYTATPPTSFYSMNISGAQRLDNGNTLVCAGPNGNFFELDTAKQIVWKYINPVGQGGAIASQGTTPTQNSVFRCTQYSINYPGFAGHNLTPGNPVELNPVIYNCSMLSGLNNAALILEKNIFPNPFDDFIHIKGYNPNEEMQLYDLSGRILYKGTNLEDQNFSMLSTGVYFLKPIRCFEKPIQLMKR